MKLNWHNLHDVLPRGSDGEKILAVVRDYVNEYEKELVSAQVVSEVLADEKLKTKNRILEQTNVDMGERLNRQAEVIRKWESVFGHLGSTPDECGNAIHAKYDEYHLELATLQKALEQSDLLNAELQSRLETTEEEIAELQHRMEGLDK